MSPLELLALSGAVEEKERKRMREVVKPGKYAVDFKAHIQGVVSVGEDSECSRTKLSLEVIATALYFTGATRESAINAVVRAAADEKTEADAERDVFVQGIVQDIRQRFAQLPKKKRAGSVKASVLVSAVN